MRQTCKACLHERRADIDQEILEGRPYREIGRKYNLAKSIIYRHKDHILPAGQQAGQVGQEAGQIAGQQAESYTGQGFSKAGQRGTESGTRRDNEGQPAGADNTGQEVLRGVIDTLRSELQGQRETLNRLLQDHAKERERADTIIMSLKGDITELNNRLFLLTEGKQAEPPETPGKPEGKDQDKTPEPPDKAEEIRFTFGDRLWFLKEDIKRILNKKIF